MEKLTSLSLSPPPLRKAVTEFRPSSTKQKDSRERKGSVDDSSTGKPAYRRNLMHDIITRATERKVRRRSSFNTTTDIENDPKTPAERLRAFFQSSVRDDEEEDDEDIKNNCSIQRGFRAFFKLQKNKDGDDDDDDDDDEDEEDDFFPQDKRTRSPIRDMFGKNKLQRLPSESDSGFLVACATSKYDICS